MNTVKILLAGLVLAASACTSPQTGDKTASGLEPADFRTQVDGRQTDLLALNPQHHSRSATYMKRNGVLVSKTAITSSRPFQCASHPLTPQSDLRQYAISGHQVI